MNKVLDLIKGLLQILNPAQLIEIIRELASLANAVQAILVEWNKMKDAFDNIDSDARE